MTCHNCHTECKKLGKHRNGPRLFRCRQCRKTFTENHDKPLGSMNTPLDKAIKVIELLVEGCSVSTAERITGVHHTTILSLLVLAGEKCERFLESIINAVPVSEVQCDELWGFVGCKEKRNLTGDPERGDAYCFVAIERKTKLILSWHLGRRTAKDTGIFIEELNDATAGRFQLTTDEFRPYTDAVHYSSGTRVDYAQLVKVHATSSEGEHRYSPAQVVDAVSVPKWGARDFSKICTSHVERQNVTMRMQIRRLARLKNAFSKKRANLRAALALYFCWYNFCRMHKSLRTPPAMATRITGTVWTLRQMLEAA